MRWAGRQGRVPQTSATPTMPSNMPVQCATPLGLARPHLLRGEDVQRPRRAASSTATALGKLGIEHSRNKMVGRGRAARYLARFQETWTICRTATASRTTSSTACAPPPQNVAVGRGDFRQSCATGQLEKCLKDGLGAPSRAAMRRGVKFENCLLVPGQAGRRHLLRHLGRRGPPQRDQGGEPAVALGGDPPPWGSPWGRCSTSRSSPRTCADDGTYEFFFCGPPLVITGATGSPINPQAIK